MEFLLTCLLAFIFSFISSPLTILFARRFGFVDNPKRKHPAIIHKKVIPRAGGVPLFLGLLGSLLVILFLNPTFSISKPLIGIMLASLVLVIVGLLDDKFDINPYFRLLTNVVAVALVVLFGIGIASVTNPLGGQIRLDQIILTFSLPESFGLLSGNHSVIVLADIAAFLWIIWVMNALNWSSGVDGQLTGIATIALFILGLVSIDLLTTTNPASQTTAFLSFAAAGSFLGFLPWSFYPQRIMPGYGGATLAGFLIATLAILSGAKFATVLLVLLIPLVDSVWAVVRRLINKKSPVWGDSFHLHHQLLRLGWSVPQICVLYYLVGLVLGIFALNFDSKEKFFAISLVGLLTFATLLTLYLLAKYIGKKL